MRLEEKLGNQHGVAITFYSIGKSYFKLEEYKKSLFHLQKSHTIMKRINHADSHLVEKQIKMVISKMK